MKTKKIILILISEIIQNTLLEQYFYILYDAYVVYM